MAHSLVEQSIWKLEIPCTWHK